MYVHVCLSGNVYGNSALCPWIYENMALQTGIHFSHLIRTGWASCRDDKSQQNLRTSFANRHFHDIYPGRNFSSIRTWISWKIQWMYQWGNVRGSLKKLTWVMEIEMSSLSINKFIAKAQWMRSDINVF